MTPATSLHALPWPVKVWLFFLAFSFVADLLAQSAAQTGTIGTTGTTAPPCVERRLPIRNQITSCPDGTAMVLDLQPEGPFARCTCPAASLTPVPVPAPRQSP